MIRIFFAFGLLAMLGACATLSENECTYADWEAIGYQDGANGKNVGHFSRHVKACTKHGITPERTPWEKGRQEGLTVFCVPENVYTVGRRGNDFPTVCAPFQNEVLWKAWLRGEVYHDYTRQIEEIQSMIDERNEILEGLTDPDDPLFDTYARYNRRDAWDIRRLEMRRRSFNSWN